MALRKIREIGDPVLEKVSKPVTEVNGKIRDLIEDMLETMYEADGVGLAAPQIGILKRIVVIDVSPEQDSPIIMINPEILEKSGEQTGSPEQDSPIIMINPEILEKSGEQTGGEGCLSVPGKTGVVTRANYVKARAFDENMQEFEIEGEELLARAIQHELDHLDGILYTTKVEGELIDNDKE